MWDSTYTTGGGNTADWSFEKLKETMKKLEALKPIHDCAVLSFPQLYALRDQVKARNPQAPLPVLPTPPPDFLPAWMSPIDSLPVYLILCDEDVPAKVEELKKTGKNPVYVGMPKESASPPGDSPRE
jgi:hypothetical protein